MSAKRATAPTAKPARSTGTKPAPPKRGPGSARRARPKDAATTYRERQLARSRYGIVYDIDGPRVRLGVAWFLLCAVCLYIGLVPLAVLFAVVAALAAAQAATVLRTRWRRPDRVAAGLVGAVVPLAAAAGTALAGVALVIGAIGVVAAAGARPVKGTDPIVDAGAVMRASLAPALAAAAVVMLYRVDIGAAVAIVLMISSYEFGDFLVGTGASNPVEGPTAGILAMLVTTAALAVAGAPPFEGASIWFFGVLAALLAPAGQVLASAILPRAGAPARALRRLDSYLLVAPVWLVLMWAGLQGSAGG